MSKTKNSIKKYLVLENIRSAENVGALFRTADAIGINKVFLIGCTPTPIDRFSRPQVKIAKAALGAEQTIPWEYFETTKECLTKLEEEGISLVVLEQSPRSIDYKKYVLEKDVAIVLGNEVDGVSVECLEKAEACIEIPMRGEKESLNVSVAGGVVLFRLFD